MALELAERLEAGRNSGIYTYPVRGVRSLALSSAAGAWTSTLLKAGYEKTTGLWQWEITWTAYADDDAAIGVANAATLPSAGAHPAVASSGNTVLMFTDGKIYITNTGPVSSGPGATAYASHPVTPYTSAVFTFIVNAATRKLWIKRDGVFLFDAAGDPVAGTNEVITIGGSGSLEPLIGSYRYTVGQFVLHQPHELQYPVSGVTPLGFVPATITFASGAITDGAGNAVTESGVIASVCDRATGVQIATTTANVSGGAATLNITADVTNGQAVVVHFHNASGTFKSLGLLNTVVV